MKFYRLFLHWDELEIFAADAKKGWESWNALLECPRFVEKVKI